MKLDGLKEKELFYLSNSLGIQKTDNKNDIINNIINKLNTLPKDEFDKITEIINKLLIEKKNNTNEKDDNNNNGNNNDNKFNNDNEEIQEKNIFYDKIFLFYSPKVNLDSKIRFCYYCCCCCSFSVETIIKIIFILNLVENIIRSLIYLSANPPNETRGIHQILISQIFNGLLFISTKNNNINFARYALLYKEYMFLYSTLTIKKEFTEINGLMSIFLPVCNNNDKESFIKCIYYTIQIYTIYFNIIIGFIHQSFEIYIAYYQLALIKIKKFKKL